MTTSEPRVLLVSPPWRTPDEGCLALATLRPILEDAGMSVDELHGTQVYPATPIDQLFMSQYAGHLFVPLLRDIAPERVLDAIVSRFTRDLDLQGLVSGKPDGEATLADLGRDETAMRTDLRRELDNARTCVESCLVAARQRSYDVIGFSVTFENQLPAALAIARGLACDDGPAIVLGGAACAGPVGGALLEAFPAVDVVCTGEGEPVVVPLVRRLAAGESLDDVPSIVWRDGTEIRRTPSAAPVTDLDALPEPDYRPFIEQLRAGPWRDYAAKLYFETSRGCWWGERGLCTFCGLNADTIEYRSKSPERAVREITTLYREYPTVRRLQATDNILDQSRYLDDVLPALARLPRRPQRPLRIFYEAKSNLSREEVHALPPAGIDLVQPGIESLDDDVLALMRKGNTALGQIQFLKWSVEAGLRLIWNLIVRNPGEAESSYRHMLDLLPSVTHLPPPDCVTPMWLERFSPYFEQPERYGIEKIRPRPYYAALYGPDADLDRLAYVFDYDHPHLEDTELERARRELVHAVGRWQHDWTPNRATAFDRGAVIELHDARGDRDAPEVQTLEGALAGLYRALDRHRRGAALRREHPALEVDPLLEAWRARRWVVTDGSDRWLAVFPRYEVEA